MASALGYFPRNHLFEAVYGVTTLHDSFFLVQSERSYLQTDALQEHTELHSYLLDANGDGLYVGTMLPLISSAAGDHLVTAVDQYDAHLVVLGLPNE